MTGFTEFIDITGDNANRAPLVRGSIRAYYATGSGGIEETLAQVNAAKGAGMGIVLIDQTPELDLFAAGKADVADIEAYAGTATAAHRAVAARQARGERSDLYASWSNQPSLKAAISSPAGVMYWVADYSWSIGYSMTMLNSHPDWSSIQYGDPNSNPGTLVPGTHVTLAQANADIDIAKSAWAAEFFHGVHPPVPVPTPAPGLPYYKNGTRVLQYLTGKPAATWMRGTDVLAIQKHIKAPAEPDSWCDGIYGASTAERVSWYEGEHHLSQEVPYGIVGPEVWKSTGLA
jgi:hypothetical protein